MLKNFFKIASRHQIKDIGVRKVSGAFVEGIAAMLSKGFLKLMIISIVIASPVAWYAMNKWLADYDYSVKISWLIFIEAELLTIVIALFTFSCREIKPQIANAVKSLRTE